ncbi:MAG: 1-acyl-sn-glycerol-3-phosphate acyltransferase [Gemmataceae bacterium]|nr:1-acyl-sn-glycerol-3-phosphate acyltransferase [Gemmataceae bacterium]
MEPWELKPARDIGLPIGASLRSLQRESGLVSTGLHWAWWTFIQAYLVLGHRLRVHGRENLPAQPPYILVANHTSHLDALVLAAPLPWRFRDRVFPIAAGDVFFETPMMATFSAFFLNALPMWRKSCGPHALQELRERLLTDPCVYVLFPEGGRSRDGKMQPFKKGLGMLVAETPVPVVPCYLEGCFDALPPNRRVPRPGRQITVRIGAPLDFSTLPNQRTGWEQLTQTVEAAVRGLRSNGPRPSGSGEPACAVAP